MKLRHFEFWGMYFMGKKRVVAGLIDGEDICRLREAVCVQVEKVYDHCREKDCVECRGGFC